MTLFRIAGLLAFGVGFSAIIAGGMVLRGWRPGYHILSWLPLYNFIMGILTVLLPAVLLWNASRYSGLISLFFFGIHAAVTALLLVAFRELAAKQSLLAMSFRLVVWVVILVLVAFA